MTPEERQIIGWCVEREEVPACVAAVPLAAWSPDAEFLVCLLVELAGVGVAVGPLDLWEIAQQPAVGYVRETLAIWFSVTDLLLLPQYAPWGEQEVTALCGFVADRYAARLACIASVVAAEERVLAARAAEMDRGCDALRSVWGGVEAVPLDLSKVHPGWLPYL